MGAETLIPGGRDVRGTLDGPDDANAVVVACPPHPQQRGHRGDSRLRAVADALAERGIACLRFDYGQWDDGYGEREDARNALRWAADRYDCVGVFGYSFGGAMAALAAATVAVDLTAVALLAPASRLADDLDAAAAVTAIDAPVQVVYATRDTTADWQPLVEQARDHGHETVEFGSDHFFVGKQPAIAETVVEFLTPLLDDCLRET